MAAKVHKIVTVHPIAGKKSESFYKKLKNLSLKAEMALEIERKFLVCGEFLDQATEATEIVQGYLSLLPDRTVRVRVRGEKGYITVKGLADDSGITRYEWEKEIPVDDARELLKLCEPTLVEKTRYLVYYGRHRFEVDVFHGANSGLVMAEIELLSADEAFEKPPWLGEEVSGDPRYYNSALSVKPYSRW